MEDEIVDPADEYVLSHNEFSSDMWYRVYVQPSTGDTRYEYIPREEWEDAGINFLSMYQYLRDSGSDVGWAYNQTAIQFPVPAYSDLPQELVDFLQQPIVDVGTGTTTYPVPAPDTYTPPSYPDQPTGGGSRTPAQPAATGTTRVTSVQKAPTVGEVLKANALPLIVGGLGLFLLLSSGEGG